MSDIPTILKGPYEEDYQRQLNQELQFAIGDTGYKITPLSTARITTITSMGFRPPLPVGSVFFDTDVAKLKVIVVAAVLDTSNAVLETITSAQRNIWDYLAAERIQQTRQCHI